MATIATLTVRLSAQIAEFQKAFAESQKTVETFTKNFEGIATRASAVGTFFGNIATKMASSLVSGLGNAIRQSVELSSTFSNSLIGLGSVARAFGVDADAASQAARNLSADGLMPLADSATGLKNLLASGFNLDQSVRLMNAFKDSAAFGRQGALSFGDAVRSATEGVKNGNSILVDNAGVTKNLSQILKEAGFSAQDLSKASTDAAVRLALFNGIIKETAAQTGDAAKLTQTYTGQISKLETSYDNLLVTLGTTITQNKTVAEAVGLVSDIFQELTLHLSDNRRGFNLVSDAVILLGKGLVSLVELIDTVQKGFTALQNEANSVSEAIIKVAILYFKAQEQASKFAKFADPGRWDRHNAAVQSAKDAVIFLEGALEGLEGATKDNTDRQKQWSTVLQDVKGRLKESVTALEQTRGQTVELGKATTTTRREVAALGEDAKEAAKKAKELAKSLEEIREEVKAVDLAVDKLVEKHEMEELAKATAKQLDDLKQSLIAFSNAIDHAFDLRHVELPGEEITDFWDRIHQMGKEAPDLGQQIADGLTVAFDEIARGTDGMVQAVSAGISQAIELFANLGKMAKATVEEKIAGIGAGIGTLLRETQKGSTQERITGGAIGGMQLGASIGSFFPGPGTAVGAGIGLGIGSLVGWWQSRKADKEATKTIQEMKRSLVEMFGSMQDIQRVGDAIGVKLAQQWGAKGREGLETFTRVAEAFEERIATLKTELADLGTRSGVASKELVAFRDAMADSAEVMAFVDQQTRSAATGIGTFLEASLVKTAAGASALSATLAGTFESLRAGGLSTREALGVLTPQITALQDQLTKTGFTGGAAFEYISHLAGIAANEISGPALDAVGGLTQALQGAFNAGFLTQEMFAGLVTEIMAQRDAIIGTGVAAETVNGLMQRDLQTIWQLTKDHGFAVDEATQAILDQAEAAGEVGDQYRSAMDRAARAMERVADALEKIIGKAGKLKGELDDIPRSVKVDVELNRTGSFDDLPAVESFARGSAGYRDFGRGTLAMLHGVEAVSTPSSPVGPGAGGPVTVNLTADFSGAYIDNERTAERMTDRLFKTIRSGGESYSEFQSLVDMATLRGRG